MHCSLFFSTYPHLSSCQSRLRNRHVNHISRHKNWSNLISQQQILAIHGSRENPLPPSLLVYKPLSKNLLSLIFVIIIRLLVVLSLLMISLFSPLALHPLNFCYEKVYSSPNLSHHLSY